MKKISALFLAVFMLMTILPIVPVTTVSAADASFVNATFESDDTTTWSTVNTITVSKASGGAGGSDYALKNEIKKTSVVGMSIFSEYGAAVFAFHPEAGVSYTLSADIKMDTCISPVPTSVSFVIKDTSKKETVVRATLDKALSKTEWTHCTADYTATSDIESVEIRIADGKIGSIGVQAGNILNRTYTCIFLLDNLQVMPEVIRGDSLAMDFEDGWYPNYGKVSNHSTVTWSDTDTLYNSKGAIHFTTTANYGSVQFPLRAAVGNSYDISVWIKPDKTPASQKATFNIYSPTADGNGATTWNTVTANHTEDFEAGKWTLCTATFTPDGKGTYMPDGVSTRTDVLEESTVEIRLGSGIPSETMDGEIAFMMDDFFVFPQVDNKIDTKERITGGGLTTEEIYEANWTFGSGSANVVWMSEGANGTAGAADITVTNDWGTLRTRNTIEMEFGRVYTLSFWAKATCEEAVGFDMYAYLSYNGHKTMEETPNWVITKPSKDPRTLTTEWQKYSIDFAPSSITREKIYPYIYFRAGAGTEKVSYAVDEISVVQKSDSNFNVGASCMRTIDGNNVVLQMNFVESTTKHFLYKMIRETANGDEVLRTVKTDETYIFLNGEDFGGLDSVRFEIVGVDAYNLCSQKCITRVQTAVPEDNITLKTDQYIWTKDMPNVSATVVYDNQTQGRTLRLIGAQYGADNALLCADEVENDVSAGDKLEWNVSIPAHEDAVKARFFAWFGDNFGPATPVAEIRKTTEGKFIYLDANSTASAENGSFSAPYKSISNARKTLRDSVANSSQKNIYMIFKSGEYIDPNYATVALTSAEYSADKNVIFTSMEGEKAQISGAKHVAGSSFSLHDADKNIYRTSVAPGTKTRHLYVNGIKATRARSQEDVVPFVNLDCNEYTASQTAGTTYTFNNLGLTSTDTSFISYKYPAELELNFIENWRHQFICPDTITESTDEAGNTVAHFGFTEGGNRSLWNSLITLNTNAKLPVFVENAYELLDEPGEWHLDTHENYLYYIPREFETVAEADFVLPIQNKLITVKGTPDAHAKNVSFQNLDFVYTTWNYPTEARAFRNNQNAFFTNPEGGSVMPGAVEIYDASGITIDNCDFKHIGSQGLKMTGAIQYSNVIGNEFYDISGLALTLGDVTHEDAAHKNQIINPTDKKYYVTDNLIANNYIHKIGTDFYSAAAVGVGFPVNTTIRNNEITDCPYSGMHTGYGWGSYASTGTVTKNFVIEKNYIHDILNWRMFDGGGIYTLGATGGTLDNMNQIRRNYFDDIKNGYGAVYPDEGSTYWEVSENVINQQRYPMFHFKEGTPSAAVWLHIHTTSIQHIHLHDNYSTTANYKENGLYNIYENPILASGDGNWPDEAQKIIDEAGIEKAYQSRFEFDIQSVRVPRVINLKVGEEKTYTYEFTSSKKIWNPTDVEISLKNTNPDAVDATPNVLTAKAEGKSWITLVLTRKENGKVVYYDEHTFCVMVQ